ncbi:extracellular ribonuclease LE-like [Magnolia sinica]|uniref:extracellular ribonuclease LE-like n=1 Tax=Magnolia sinica TaxID=86752 RepID=UPI002659D4CD|nr:extracellular ribonuclease LE-like [Magnolia sinica]
MSARIAIPILLSVLLLSGAHVFGSFDYYRFVVEWPGSICKDVNGPGCCRPTTGNPKEDFHVKALYTYSGSQPITKCNTTKFDVNLVSSISEELNEYWPTIKCPSNNGHTTWNDAWRLYGVCTGLGQKDYFKTALKLRSKINLFSLFKRNGIVPSVIDSYDFVLVKNTIRGGIGASAAIECTMNEWGEHQMTDIHICVARDGTTIIQCPTLPKFKCDTLVSYPIFTFDMLKETSMSTNPIKMSVSE